MVPSFFSSVSTKRLIWHLVNVFSSDVDVFSLLVSDYTAKNFVLGQNRFNVLVKDHPQLLFD